MDTKPRTEAAIEEKKLVAWAVIAARVAGCRRNGDSSGLDTHGSATGKARLRSPAVGKLSEGE